MSHEKAMFESGPALTTDAIVEWENRTGRSIPGPYRVFLLEYNGGYPDPADFTMRGDGGTVMEGAVERFLGLNMGKYASLDYYLETYGDRMPEDVFPIAADPGGNLIVMSVSAGEYGRVFFWDHEEEAEQGEPPTRRNLYLVAESLDELLHDLH